MSTPGWYGDNPGRCGNYIMNHPTTGQTKISTSASSTKQQKVFPLPNLDNERPHISP